MTSSATTERLILKGVSHSFGSNAVLSDVDIGLRIGEVLALAGKNSAGRFTLMKIIGGYLTPQSGSVKFENRQVKRRRS
jgi:ABC-type sugar transport system ATPase subunit